MGRVIKIILVILLLLTSGALAAMYFDVVTPPQFVKKICISKVLTDDQKDKRIKDKL